MKKCEQYAAVEEEDVEALKDRVAEGLLGQEKYEEAAELYLELGNIWVAAAAYAEVENYARALEITEDIPVKFDQLKDIKRWKRAQSILDVKAGDYEDAWKLMKDDSEKYEEEWGQAVYGTAKFLLKEKRYRDAILLGNKIEKHIEEAGTLLTECYEKYGIECAEKGDYEKALEAFRMCEITDAVKPALYNVGKAYMDREDYLVAISVWDMLKDYQDSAAQQKECYRQQGFQYEKERSFASALDMFEKCGDESLIQDCYYNRANYYADEVNDYENAIKDFTSLGDYKDSTEKIRECYFNWADQYRSAQNYEKAIEIYTQLGDDKKIRETKFDWAYYFVSYDQYSRAIELYTELGSEEQVLRAQEAEQKYYKQQRAQPLAGEWRTSDGNLRISFSGDLVTFYLPVNRYDNAICGVDLHKVFQHHLFIDNWGSYNMADADYTGESWDYRDEFLILESNAYSCKVNENTMTLIMDGQTFTLKKQ